MNQEIATKEQGGALTQEQLDSEWGAPEISSNDIEIPMVYLMQYMSKKVKDQEAKFGEFRDSAENLCLGGISDTFEVIPFFVDRKWVDYEVSGDNEKKWLSTYAVTPENDNQKYEEGNIQRDRVYYFYCLPVDGYDDAIPFIIPMRRTSAKTARYIMTQMYTKNRKAGLSPAAYRIILGSKEENGKKGDYAVITYRVGERTSKEQEAVCLQWLKSVKSGAAKAAEDEEIESTQEKSVNKEDLSEPREF